jgi:hypothetical protein
MADNVLLLAALLTLAGFIAMPALMAFRQKRRCEEASDVAIAIANFALAVRVNARIQPLDADLRTRAERLRLPELASLLLAIDLPRSPELLADTAQRLALRLKRRVAFERKMLARTASGRRRGAIAASLAPLVFIALRGVGLGPPLSVLILVLAVEASGCWMLWRMARIEI